MKCEICQRNPIEAGALFRINEKGETGTWRCESHPPASGQCCCNYVLSKMCGFHHHVLLGDSDPLNIITRRDKAQEFAEEWGKSHPEGVQ